MTLKSRLILRFVFMPVMWGSLLFLPAGSFRFWQGWVYFIIMLAFAVSAFGYLYRHDPQLIERRLRGGWRQETVRQQKLIMNFIPAIMLIAFLLSSLDHRFGWSHLLVVDDSFGGMRSRRLPDDLLDIEEQQFRSQYDSSRVWPESDFHRSLWHRPPSHVFRRGDMVVIHAAGARFVLRLTCFCPPHPFDRSPAPQRRESPSPRTARLCRILSPHALSACTVPLVSDIFSKARRSR